MSDIIKIGIAGPKTGPVSQYGDMQFMGARMAIEQINAKGGIGGRMLVAVEYDDACDPRQAVAVANKITHDGVKFVVGHMGSSCTQPAGDIYEDEGVLMITPGSTSPEITARGYKMTFRTIGVDSSQSSVAGDYIAAYVKPKIVAVLHDNQQYGEGIATAVKNTLEAKGIKVAMFEGINADDKDFSSVIVKLEQANVDFVYYGGRRQRPHGDDLRRHRHAALRRSRSQRGPARVGLGARGRDAGRGPAHRGRARRAAPDRPDRRPRSHPSRGPAHPAPAAARDRDHRGDASASRRDRARARGARGPAVHDRQGLDPRPRALPGRAPGAPAGQGRGDQLRLAHHRAGVSQRPVPGAPRGHPVAVAGLSPQPLPRRLQPVGAASSTRACASTAGTSRRPR